MGFPGLRMRVSLAARSVLFIVLPFFLLIGGSHAQVKPGRQSKAVTPSQPAQTSQPAATASDGKEEGSEESEKPEEKAFKGLKYRLIGPFRGGRSLTAAGIPGDPTTYYFGATGGGVWKSTDGAMTWSSVFDKEGTSAIGSLAVANSNHNVLYVGTGRPAYAATSRTAMGCTSRWMAARPGRTLGCAIRALSARSLSIRPILTLFLSLRSDIHMGRTLSAEFSGPLMAVRIGRKFCTKMRTRVASTLHSIRIIPIFCSARCGRHGEPHGV